ncbi:MAG TPA: DNA mismatch repair protein MutS [Syntrophomonadaceae bacterium]|nr:DNA mismatch repair protein MutS [Syntrophomonadaceae bacterium]
MAKYTPMLQQYLEIKSQHPDTLLFFRLGDFYEMFFDDAEVASRELEIVLTARDGGDAGRIPMCGVPHHSAHTYIAKLISRGYRVAICEQMEDPREAKGLVKREVVRIITPGTVIEDNMLSDTAANYLASVYIDDESAGLAFADISTGEFKICQWHGKDVLSLIYAELLRLNPSECLIAEDQPSLWTDEQSHLTNLPMVTAEFPRSYKNACEVLMHHFKVATLEGFGINDSYDLAVCAAAAILKYLEQTCHAHLHHLQAISIHHNEQYMLMDMATRRNLELTSTIRDGKREGSLLSILDYCCTAMGRRRLKSWIELPLRDLSAIQARHDAVQELKDNLQLRSSLLQALSEVYDMERLAGKIGSQMATPRDLIALKQSLQKAEVVKELLQGTSSTMLKNIAQLDVLADMNELLTRSINDAPPLSLREGDIIKKGYSPEIDELRLITSQGSDWLVEYENREKERTGIKYLKVAYNKVFGYYIEVSKSNLHLVPEDYHRKQTLVNTERFISDELKQYEERILGARERLYNLEYAEFCRIREDLINYLPRLQNTAEQMSVLDVLVSLAEAAFNNNYVRPIMDNSGIIDARSARHPVVEKHLVDSRFVPNDVKLNQEESRFAIITGPNMGGKSTYMRQTALMVVMAQMGSFVPADYARIGLVDRVFTRVGAADDLSAGQSTFMVEMVEVANILNNATADSLIILDEIGRGTSTYDGLSIAQAVSEYIVSHIKARTLFATHYHELTQLEETLPGVINLSVSVQESGDSVIFLKRVLPGRADRSYGVHVAQLAGLKREVIDRAQEILRDLETKSVKKPVEVVEQPSLFMVEDPIIQQLRRINPDELTPREALALIYKWKDGID